MRKYHGCGPNFHGNFGNKGPFGFAMHGFGGPFAFNMGFNPMGMGGCCGESNETWGPNTKEDAEKFLDAQKKNFERIKQGLETSLEKMKHASNSVDDLIEELKKTEKYDPKEFQKSLKKKILKFLMDEIDEQ